MAPTNPLSPIPHPPKKPIVGNMLSLDSSAPMKSLNQLADELGPIYWLDMMGAPIVFVSGFDLVDELCDEKRFDKAVRGALRRVRAIAGRRFIYGRYAGAELEQGAQHLDVALRQSRDDDLSPGDGRYCRAACAQMGAHECR